MYKKFYNDQEGAITVDWVMLTAGAMGVAIAATVLISQGVSGNVGNMSNQLSSQTITTSFDSQGNTTTWSGLFASDYLAYGQSKAPGNNGAAYAWAQQAAADDAPSGFNFDNPLADPDSGNVIYTSNDGTQYSIGGNVVNIADYTGQANYYGA